MCFTKVKDVLMDPDKVFYFDIFHKLDMDVPKLLGTGQNWFWH